MATNPLDDLLEVFRRFDSFVIAGHEHPDGDCLGSQVALGHFLRQRDKRFYLVNPDPPRPAFDFLPHRDWIDSTPPPEDVQVGIVLDSGDISRLGSLQAYMSERPFLVNIDHHPPRERNIGDLNLIDPESSCVGEILYRLYKRVDEPFTTEVALALYISLVTDTGSFRYANTRALTHQAAAELIRAGEFEPYRVYSQIYERESFNSTRLQGRILSNLHVDDGIVWAEVPTRYFEETDTTEDDLNEIMDHFRRIKDCRVALLFREQPDNRVKINFRAKGEVNLLEVVDELGGGGHEKAAGATVDGTLTDVRERVISMVRNELYDGVQTG